MAAICPVQNFQDFSDDAGAIVELTFTQQSTAFMYSLLLGVCLGVFYEALKIIRLSFGFCKAGTIALDILFMLISSISVFLFSLAFLLGFIRIYVIAGTFSGFFAYKMLIGRVASKLYCPLISFFQKKSHNIWNKIKKIAKKLLKNTYNILYNISKRKRIFRGAAESAPLDKRVNDRNDEKKKPDKKNSGSSKSGK